MEFNQENILMNTVNMNELLAAHINFNIQSKDVGFGDDGELQGYSESSEGYFKDDRVETDFTPLCDTAELSDDAVRPYDKRTVEVKTGMTLFELIAKARIAARNRRIVAKNKGLKKWRKQAQIDVSKLEWRREVELGEGRWCHYADADAVERQAKITTYLKLDITKRPWREMEVMSRARKERYARLLTFIDGCYNPKTLSKLRYRTKGRYINAIKSIMAQVRKAQSKCDECRTEKWACRSCLQQGDWWAQYLTKHEMTELWAIIDDRVDAIYKRKLKAPRKPADSFTKMRKSRAKRKASGLLVTTAPMQGVIDWRPEGFIGPMKQMR